MSDEELASTKERLIDELPLDTDFHTLLIQAKEQQKRGVHGQQHRRDEEHLPGNGRVAASTFRVGSTASMQRQSQGEEMDFQKHAKNATKNKAFKKGLKKGMKDAPVTTGAVGGLVAGAAVGGPPGAVVGLAAGCALGAYKKFTKKK